MIPLPSFDCKQHQLKRHVDVATKSIMVLFITNLVIVVVTVTNQQAIVITVQMVKTKEDVSVHGFSEYRRQVADQMALGKEMAFIESLVSLFIKLQVILVHYVIVKEFVIH